jgi:hypothetical protein
MLAGTCPVPALVTNCELRAEFATVPVGVDQGKPIPLVRGAENDPGVTGVPASDPDPVRLRSSCRATASRGHVNESGSPGRKLFVRTRWRHVAR